jgi:uncharacterized membrane-anchored protein
MGWASQPFYDSERKVLHWAKELRFSDSDGENTLNYNVRVLGRKGVLVLNAIGGMSQLPAIKKDINGVLGMVSFSPGSKYSDFDPGVDEVAAWTIGGLVAGKVLAKVGMFAVLAKFWKLILIGLIGAGSWFWKLFKKKKEDKELLPLKEEPLKEEDATA